MLRVDTLANTNANRKYKSSKFTKQQVSTNTWDGLHNSFARLNGTKCVRANDNFGEAFGAKDTGAQASSHTYQDRQPDLTETSELTPQRVCRGRDSQKAAVAEKLSQKKAEVMRKALGCNFDETMIETLMAEIQDLPSLDMH